MKEGGRIMKNEIVGNADREALYEHIKEACDMLADQLTDEVFPMFFRTPSGEKHFGFKIFKSKEDDNEIIIKFYHTF
jgi:hypothetical protein